MTLANVSRRAGPYTTNGVTTTFNYNFKITTSAHISVLLVTTGVSETTLTIGTHYTVTGVGIDAGGSIVLTAAGLTLAGTGKQIFINSVIPYDQSIDISNQGALFYETFEQALDLAAMRDQQLTADVAAVWDFLNSNGTSWPLVQLLSRVVSVAGRSGIVTLTTADMTDMSANGRSLVQAANYAAMKTLLGLDGTSQWSAPIVKAADFTKTSDTTLANDPELLFNMSANKKYLIRGRLTFQYTGSGIAGGGWKIGITGPASPTAILASGREVSASVTAYSQVDELVYTTNATTKSSTEFSAYISNGVNAGSFRIQFAQNSSFATGSKLLAGLSYIEYREVA